MAKKLSKAELARTKTDFDAPEMESRNGTALKEAKHTGKGNPNGRPPSLAPRTQTVAFRLSDVDRERLDEAAAMLDTTKTKVVVEGIEAVYLRAKKEERRKRRKEWKAMEKWSEKAWEAAENAVMDSIDEGISEAISDACGEVDETPSKKFIKELDKALRKHLCEIVQKNLRHAMPRLEEA